eukprot:gene8330-biopygen15158
MPAPRPRQPSQQLPVARAAPAPCARATPAPVSCDLRDPELQFIRSRCCTDVLVSDSTSGEVGPSCVESHGVQRSCVELDGVAWSQTESRGVVPSRTEYGEHGVTLGQERKALRAQ